jgi:hypothetical protein
LIPQRFEKFADALEGLRELLGRPAGAEQLLVRLGVVDRNFRTSDNCVEDDYLQLLGKESEVA